MGRKIVIASGRGGVGKTVLTACMGAVLAHRGAKVLLIDADTGLRGLDIALGLENNVVYDCMDVVEGTCALKRALLADKARPGLTLLPAAQSRERSDLTPDAMRDILAQVNDMYDYILIDSPAGTERGAESACAGADEAIIVAGPDPVALRSAQRMVGWLEQHSLLSPKVIFNRMRGELSQAGILPTISQAKDMLSCDVIGALPECDAIMCAYAQGQTPDAQTPLGREIEAIVRRLEGEEIPVVIPDIKPEFSARLKESLRILRGVPAVRQDK